MMTATAFRLFSGETLRRPEIQRVVLKKAATGRNFFHLPIGSNSNRTEVGKTFFFNHVFCGFCPPLLCAKKNRLHSISNNQFRNKCWR